MESVTQIFGKGIENAASVIGFKDPKKGKVIIIGSIAIIAGILIGLSVRRYLKKKRAGDYSVLDMEKEIGQIGPTKNATLTEGKAILIAQNLLGAMNRLGTDEQAIYDNLNQCKNKDDLLLVIQKFGIKPYDGWGLADTWLSKNIGSTMKNLNGWLRAEMSRRELKPVITIYNNFGVPF